jgi:hypothetical protein
MSSDSLKGYEVVAGRVMPGVRCFALNFERARDLLLPHGARLLTVQLIAHVPVAPPRFL